MLLKRVEVMEETKEEMRWNEMVGAATLRKTRSSTRKSWSESSGSSPRSWIRRGTSTRVDRAYHSYLQ